MRTRTGEYEKSEMIIQQLLAEAGNGGIGHELVAVDGRGAEAPADWASLKSPENYVGAITSPWREPRSGRTQSVCRRYRSPCCVCVKPTMLETPGKPGKGCPLVVRLESKFAFRSRL
jgi:hypothetical protein